MNRMIICSCASVCGREARSRRDTSAVGEKGRHTGQAIAPRLAWQPGKITVHIVLGLYRPASRGPTMIVASAPKANPYEGIPTLASLNYEGNASDLVLNQMDEDDFPDYLADPTDILGGMRVAMDLVMRNLGQMEAPYGLYSPDQAAAALRTAAACVDAFAKIMPAARRACADAAGRAEADAAMLPSADLDECACSELAQAGATLRTLADSYMRVPYSGFTDPGRHDYPKALVAELERRGLTVVEWEDDDNYAEISYIDFQVEGLLYEIRSEEGWSVRHLPDTEDNRGCKVVELDGGSTHFNSAAHPRLVIDAAVSAIDRFTRAQLPRPR
jgi:hypothetical protein